MDRQSMMDDGRGEDGTLGPTPMDEGRESERGPELPVEPTGQMSDRKFSRVRVCSVPGLSHLQPVIRSPPCLVRLWGEG